MEVIKPITKVTYGCAPTCDPSELRELRDRYEHGIAYIRLLRKSAGKFDTVLTGALVGRAYEDQPHAGVSNY